MDMHGCQSASWTLAIGQTNGVITYVNAMHMLYKSTVDVNNAVLCL